MAEAVRSGIGTFLLHAHGPRVDEMHQCSYMFHPSALMEDVFGVGVESPFRRARLLEHLPAAVVKCGIGEEPSGRVCVCVCGGGGGAEPARTV